MHDKVRPLLSLCVIGLFLMFALASLGPDSATNTSVGISDCEEMPPVSVTLDIFVDLEWRTTSAPVAGAFGKLFITHQKVNSDKECTYTIESTKTIDFICDANGEYDYHGNTWIHDNKEDLIRVEIYIPVSIADGYNAVRRVAVRKYNEGTFNFSYDLIPIL